MMDAMSKRVLHVVTDATGADRPSWLAALDAAWATLHQAGFEQVVVSPSGGDVGAGDASDDLLLRTLLHRSAAPAQIDAGDFDAMLHVDDAASAALATSPGLQRIARSIVDHGGLLATLGDDAAPLTALCADAERVLTGVDAATALAARVGANGGHDGFDTQESPE